MKLTQEQICYLYEFTRQHYVEYYDLQTELVDHLANSIEEQWQENPKLFFETALNIEFKKFGIFGFMDVVEKRQKALSKKYYKLIWKHFIEFFKLPKIILTIFLIQLVYLILKNCSIYSDIFFWAYLLVTVFSFRKMFLDKQKLDSKKAKLEKRWLFKEIIVGCGGSPVIFVFPYQIMNHFHNDLTSNLKDPKIVLFYSIFLVFYTIYAYIVQKVIPSKAEEYLKQTYTEYNLQKL